MSDPIRFIDPARDPWQAAPADAPLPAPASRLLLTPAQWLAVRGTWPAGLAAGVSVPNDVDIETLEADLDRFALVALQFPKWVDGRAYSQARLLRRRFRYAGEVRATGEVLVDMLPLLVRTGFDAALLRADQRLDSARRAFAFFPAHYQGDVRQPLPLYARTEARA